MCYSSIVERFVMDVGIGPVGTGDDVVGLIVEGILAPEHGGDFVEGVCGHEWASGLRIGLGHGEEPGRSVSVVVLWLRGSLYSLVYI